MPHASQTQYNLPMKTATIPSVRVEPAFRAEIEAVLGDSESLSEFVETAVLESVRRRRNQAEFIARGMASLEAAKRTEDYVDADKVVGRLERKLGAAKAATLQGRR